MELQDFIEIVTRYEQEAILEPEFWEARDGLENYLASLLASKELEVAGKFLRIWNKNRGPVVKWEQLAKVWTQEMQRSAQHLSQERLEDSENESLREAAKLYCRLVKVDGIGDTNASKLLALSLLELCMMWDGPVRGCFRKNYLPRPRKRAPTLGGPYEQFLRHERKVAQDLVKQCMQQRNCGRTDAVTWLRQLPTRLPNSLCPREKPLAKLLDEYNYWKTR